MEPCGPGERTAGGSWGDGSVTDRSAPVRVANVSGAIAIAAGDSFALALRSDGAVRPWAEQHRPVGRCRRGAESYAARAIRTGRAAAVAAGVRYSLALRSDGTVWAGWGDALDRLYGLTNIIAISGGDEILRRPEHRWRRLGVGIQL